MKEIYDTSCPYCNKKLTARPSLFHRMGKHDMGGGSCLYCKQVFDVHYDAERDALVAKKLNLNQEA